MKNMNFQLSAVEELNRREMNLVSSEQVKKFRLHAIKEEEKYNKMNWNS